MNGQMTLMEMLGEIDPLKEVARTANVYWKQSRDKLKDLYSKDPDDYDWTCAVRHEYCPYEAQGRWGSGNGPNTVEGYYMNWQGGSASFTTTSAARKKRCSEAGRTSPEK